LTGSMISGGGNWCGEAGPCGTVTVTGTVNGDAVHLDLTYTAQLPITRPDVDPAFRRTIDDAQCAWGVNQYWDTWDCPERQLPSSVTYTLVGAIGCDRPDKTRTGS